MNLSSDIKRRMTIHALQKRIGDPTEEVLPGAHTGASKELFETNPSLIVFVNFATGDDGTGDGTSGNPFKTYSKGVAEIGATSKTTLEWQTTDEIGTSEEITVPTQTSIGIISVLGGGGLNVWAQATTPSFGGSRITAIDTDSAGKWVAVGLDGKIGTSTDDGDTWSQVSSALPGSSTISSVATDSAGNWLAGANLGKISLSSDNGDSWALSATSVFGSASVVAIATDSAGNWVAAASDGIIAISSNNGATWTLATDTAIIIAPAAITTDSSGKWILVGGGGKVAISSDNGDTWVLSGTVVFGLDIISSVKTDSLGNWVAVTFNDKIGFSSDNGSTWTLSATTVFSGAGVAGLDTDSLGKWMAAGGLGRIAISSDNGLTWILVALPSFGATSIDAITTDSDGAWVAVGLSGKIGLNIGGEIAANVCGFSITDPLVVSVSGLIFLQVSMSIDKTCITSALDILIKKSSLTSIESDAVVIVFDELILTNSFLQAKAAGKRALKITGAAAAPGDIRLEFNSFLASINTETAIEIDNDTGGAGNELLQNNIIEGGVIATETVNPFTIESGNIRGSIDAGVLLSSQVSSSDPLFISTSDFRLQRESGYSDTVTAAFDSPLVEAARDHATALINHQVTSGLNRDYGCFSYDDDSVSAQFTISTEMDRPNGVKFRPVNRAKVYDGVSGVYDIFNDTERRGEKLTLSWMKGISDTDIAFFDLIETAVNTTIFLALDPTELITQPSVTIDGAHAVGEVVINIASTQIFTGSSMILSEDNRQFIMYGLNAANAKAVENVVKLVLAEPLKEALTDAQLVPMVLPFGTGEYIYLPSENPGFTRQHDSSRKLLKGFSVNLIRKKP